MPRTTEFHPRAVGADRAVRARSLPQAGAGPAASTCTASTATALVGDGTSARRSLGATGSSSPPRGTGTRTGRRTWWLPTCPVTPGPTSTTATARSGPRALRLRGVGEPYRDREGGRLGPRRPPRPPVGQDRRPPATAPSDGRGGVVGAVRAYRGDWTLYVGSA